MADKDIITKEYMQDNEVFADAFNFFMYNGRQVIRPENLRELDTTAIALPYGEDNKPIPVQKERDLLKIAVAMEDDNAAYLLLGIENQSQVHYAMPVKNGLYDMIQYTNQVIKAEKAHRAAKNYGDSKAEFLSGFYKTDRLLPVITLVIYFGAEKWDAPKSIYEMLSVHDEEILKYVADYRINLISPEELTDDEFSKFHTELRSVLKYIKYSNDDEKLNMLLHSDDTYRSVSRKTADVINIVTNSDIKFYDGEENVNMCKAIEDMINKRTKVLEEKYKAAEGKYKAAEDRCKAIEDMINKRTKVLEEKYKAAEGKYKAAEKGKAELVENLRKVGVPEEQIQKALNGNC